MSALTIIHNPRCSKSREALRIIKEKGINPEIIEYLKNPLTVDQLKEILEKLQLSPQNIIRKKEGIYKELLAINPFPSDNDLLNWMASNPILIERPIVFRKDSAVIGRPPKNVHKIL